MKLLLLLPLLLTGCCLKDDPATNCTHQWQDWGPVSDVSTGFRQFRYCETCNAGQARTVRY